MGKSDQFVGFFPPQQASTFLQYKRDNSNTLMPKSHLNYKYTGIHYQTLSNSCEWHRSKEMTLNKDALC